METSVLSAVTANPSVVFRDCYFERYDPFNNFGLQTNSKKALLILQNINDEVLFQRTGFIGLTNNKEFSSIFLSSQCKTGVRLVFSASEIFQ